MAANPPARMPAAISTTASASGRSAVRELARMPAIANTKPPVASIAAAQITSASTAHASARRIRTPGCYAMASDLADRLPDLFRRQP